jgi:hypothetical protein
MVGSILLGSLGSQISNMTVVKYNSSGVIQWAKEIGNSGVNDNAYAVAVDSAGNAYMVGSSILNSPAQSAAIVKYNPSGTLLWQRALTGPTNGDTNQFSSIAIDSSDNIFVCGRTTVSTATVGMIAKYSSSGTLLWQRKINDAGGGVTLDGVSVDSLGNVYAAGQSNVGGLIVKYDTNGVLQWQRKVTGNNVSLGPALINLDSIAFDSSGIMTVGGSLCPDQLRSNTNMFVLKVPSDGSLTGTYLVNEYDVTYDVDNNTEAALSQTPVTSTMNSVTVNYIAAGPSTLTESTSSFVNLVTPITGSSPTVSGAPTIGVATATGTTTADVTFTAPASDGGSTILSYTATSSPGGITGVLTQAGSGTINVTGLSSSTSYTFTVTATNAIGTSDPSAASNSITTNTPGRGNPTTTGIDFSMLANMPISVSPAVGLRSYNPAATVWTVLVGTSTYPVPTGYVFNQIYELSGAGTYVTEITPYVVSIATPDRIGLAENSSLVGSLSKVMFSFELTTSSYNGSGVYYDSIGVVAVDSTITTLNNTLGSDTQGIGIFANGSVAFNGSTVVPAGAPTFVSNGSIVDILVDGVNKRMWYSVNGSAWTGDYTWTA